LEALASQTGVNPMANQYQRNPMTIMVCVVIVTALTALIATPAISKDTEPLAKLSE